MKKIIVFIIIGVILFLASCSSQQSLPLASNASQKFSKPQQKELLASFGSTDSGQFEEEGDVAVVEKDDGSVESGSAKDFVEPTPTSTPESWEDYPVIPTISQSALAIYQKGIEMGRDPRSFSKIGDCQNITTYFLAPLENPKLYSLGEEYSYLQGTIDYFHGSFSRESLAVAGGLNVARVLSPFHADLELCEPNEHPLACEVRVNNPSIAIVSLEENWSSRTEEEYAEYLRKVIEYLIGEGVLPILGTKADNLEGDHRINKTIVRLAQEYELPVWNFWRAVQPLPNHGLQEDGFHLTVAGPYFDSKGHMKSAWPWRNLTALQSLHAVLEAVEEN